MASRNPAGTLKTHAHRRHVRSSLAPANSSPRQHDCVLVRGSAEDKQLLTRGPGVSQERALETDIAQLPEGELKNPEDHSHESAVGGGGQSWHSRGFAFSPPVGISKRV